MPLSSTYLCGSQHSGNTETVCLIFHLCSFALCRETCCLYWNFLPHVGQEYCSLFSWFRTCSFQYFFTFVVNELHMSHLYSTLLWLSVCTTKSALCMNHRSHPLCMHLCVLIVLWTILYCSSCPWKLNRWPMLTSFTLSLRGTGLISTVVLAFPIGISVALSSSWTISSSLDTFPKARRASVASSSSVVVTVSCPNGNVVGKLLDTDVSTLVFVISGISKLLLCGSVIFSGVLVSLINSETPLDANLRVLLILVTTLESLILLTFTTKSGNLSISSCKCRCAGFPWLSRFFVFTACLLEEGPCWGEVSLVFVVLVYQGLYLVPPTRYSIVGSLSYVASSLSVMVWVAVEVLVSLEVLSVACHPYLLCKITDK